MPHLNISAHEFNLICDSRLANIPFEHILFADRKVYRTIPGIISVSERSRLQGAKNMLAVGPEPELLDTYNFLKESIIAKNPHKYEII